LINKLIADLPDVDLTRIFVTHSGCVKDAEYLADRINELKNEGNNEKEIFKKMKKESRLSQDLINYIIDS